MIPYKFKGTAMPINGILAQLAVPVYTYWHTCPLMCRVAIISLNFFFCFVTHRYTSTQRIQPKTVKQLLFTKRKNSEHLH